MRKMKDLTNQIFGRWKVIKQVGKNKCGQIIWLCECSCENKTQKEIVGTSLTNGTSISCGCYKNEQTSKANKKYNTYDLSGTYGVGYTLNSEIFYFDLEDYDKIKDYCWRLNDKGYVVTDIKHYPTRMHRIILNVSEDMQVDHKNRIKIDNRKNNLREATNQQNSFNKLNIKQKRIGVYFDNTRQKWIPHITVNGHKIYLGRYNTFEEALKVRELAEQKYFGEFAPQKENKS